MTECNNSHLEKESRIVFIVPLKSKAISKDWDLTCYFLEKTLCSILRQKDNRFEIRLVCHDTPDLPINIKSQIKFLEANYPPLTMSSTRFERNSDKLCKHAIGLKSLVDVKFSHYMFVDADDIVSSNTASLAFSDRYNAVKIMKVGYIFDETTKQLWLVDRFSSLCGTCGIFPFDKRLLAQIECDVTISDIRENPAIISEKNLYSLMSHTRWAKAAEQSGLPVSQISVPHAIYRWNYGDQTNDPQAFRLSVGKSIRRHLPPVFSRGKRWKPVQINNAIRREFCIY